MRQQMKPRRNSLGRSAQLGAAFVATMVLFYSMSVLITPSIAEAGGYNFDPSCSATNTETIDEPATPNAMLMLDKSGSMSSLGLWDPAVSVIDSLTESLDDELRFGLGFFPDGEEECEMEAVTECDSQSTESGYQGMCSNPVTRWVEVCEVVGPNASIRLECSDNAHSAISSELDSEEPGGGTPTADAIAVTSDSDSLNASDRPSAGMVITDGQPCCGGNARDAAIDAACDVRDEGQLMYTIGLGGATDQDFNNKMAAAMGTGCCGPGCDPDDGVGNDPCVQDVDSEDCTGAYQADDQQNLENELLGISEEIACIFEVDTSLHDEGEAPDDPDALKVEWEKYGVIETIPHRSETGEGWYFPTGESREQISLTSTYCDDIRGGNGVEEVTTQLACDCQVDDGEPCMISDTGFGECPYGEYGCDSGYTVCEALAIEHCPEDCPGMDSVMGQSCHVDNQGDITESGPPTEPYDWESETNRCKIGEVRCADNGTEPVCAQAHNPMPELCDGLDNSCDGSINNITQTWDDWYAGEGQFDGGGAQGDPDLQPIGDTEEAATCWERDECLCSSIGAGEHVGTGGSEAEEFEAYMQAWDGYPDGCYCNVDMGR